MLWLVVWILTMLVMLLILTHQIILKITCIELVELVVQNERSSTYFSTEKEQDAVRAIEELMDMTIPLLDFPEAVEVSKELIEEERPQIRERNNPHKRKEMMMLQDLLFMKRKTKIKKRI